MLPPPGTLAVPSTKEVNINIKTIIAAIIAVFAMALAVVPAAQAYVPPSGFAVSGYSVDGCGVDLEWFELTTNLPQGYIGVKYYEVGFDYAAPGRTHTGVFATNRVYFDDDSFNVGLSQPSNPSDPNYGKDGFLGTDGLVHSGYWRQDGIIGETAFYWRLRAKLTRDPNYVPLKPDGATTDWTTTRQANLPAGC